MRCSWILFTLPAVLAIPFKSPVTVASGFTADVISNNLTAPRGVAVDSADNVLVVERGFGVSAFSLENGNWVKTVVVENAGVTHGIALDSGRLYVSTASEVTGYFYDPDTKSATDQFAFVSGLPADGGKPSTCFITSLQPDTHVELTTHALLLQRNKDGVSKGIYVGAGPLTNIDITARDPTSGRSQIRLIHFPEVQIAIFPPPPLLWSEGEVVAYGIRNPAAFAFPPSSQPSLKSDLYVVENAASIDNVTGVTPEFANDNPADELEIVKVTKDAKSYGFPDCSTVWNSLGRPYQKGDQFSFQLDGTLNDNWCQTKANNEPPSLIFQVRLTHFDDFKCLNINPTLLQAHSVPLDIKFASSGQSAVVTFHGSFDRNPPTGYGVVR